MSSHANPICPSLGLPEDADSSFAFPSNMNYCHHNSPASSVQTIHQEDFCLSGKYQECPVFLMRQTRPPQRNTGASRVRANKTSPGYRKYVLIALIILVTVFILQSGKIPFLTSGSAPRTATTTFKAAATATRARATATVTAPGIKHTATSAVSTGNGTVTNTPTITSTPTSSATFTRTPLPTSIVFKRHLDNPFGTDYKFVVHKAKGSERLEGFAEKYNTTVEAILSINYRLSNPTWSDVLFVIPVGFSQVEKLPIFVVYQVKEEERGFSADDLAKKLRANPFDLKYYNGMLAAGERPLVGDLILVPWPRSNSNVHFDEPDRWDNK